MGGAYATSCNADLIDVTEGRLRCRGSWSALSYDAYSNVIVNNDPDFDPVISQLKGIRNPVYHGGRHTLML